MLWPVISYAAIPIRLEAIMQDWLNRIGLTLQFVALFLVTPEIVGEEKVKDVTDRLIRKPLRSLAVRLVDSHRLATNLSLATFLLICLALSFFFGELLKGPFSALIVLAFPVAAGATFIFLLWSFSRIVAWLVQTPRSFLPIGAALFTCGFALLMWATFVRAT